MREKMGRAAVKAAKAAKYNNVGTIEFLFAEDEFYFMEMNTRIQVEHTVTEVVFGMDLLKRQIRLAAGAKIEEVLKNFKLRGHAIECRINAENPDKDFRPCPGKITSFHVPGGPGVRVDTHAYAQYVIPPYYDSLIAKVIASGQTRDEAIGRMKRALEEFIIEGIYTTIPFHIKVMNEKNFVKGDFDTKYIENYFTN